MGFDLQRAAVVTGDGIVARFPGVLCVAWCTEREPLQHLLQLCADVAGPEPGRALARRLVTWLAGPDAPGDGLVFGTVAAAGEQIAVFLSGTAGVEVTGTGITVSGADSASWTDRLLGRPDTALVLALDGSANSGTTDVSLFDLRAGVVPGAGAVLLPGADPGQGPGSARGGDPGWSTPEPGADQGLGAGGYQSSSGYSSRSGTPVSTHGALSSRSERSHRATSGSGDGSPYDSGSYRRDPSMPSRRSRRLSASARHWAVEEEPEEAVAEVAAAPPVGVPVARTPSSGEAMAAGVQAPTPPLAMPVVPDYAEPPVAEYAAPEAEAPTTNGYAESDYRDDPQESGQPDSGHTNGYSNGHSNGHSNGYADTGYTENGYTENGYTENGYADNAAVENTVPEILPPENGYAENGYTDTAHAENGYAENQYTENQYTENQYAESAAEPVVAAPEQTAADDGVPEDFSAGEWFGGADTAEPGEAPQQSTDLLGLDPDDPDSGLWTEPGEVVAAAPEPVEEYEQPAADQQYDETTDQPVRDAVAAAEAAPMGNGPMGSGPAESGPPVPEEPPDDGEVPTPQAQAAQIMGVDPGEPPRPPLASGAPAMQNGTNGSGVATTDEQQAQGHLCARGHLNDPRSHFCVLCGIRMNERTGVLVVGTRPPLGLLVFDDGATYTVDAEYLVGRMPEADPRVRSGALRSIVIEDRTGAVSRVHAEIRVNGWDVLLSDSGSRNGTFVAGASETGWTPLAPGRGRRLVPGTRVRIGGRSFVFESPSGVR